MQLAIYIAKRLLLLIPLLLGVTFVVFLLTRVVIEGNPVDRFVPPMASAEEREKIASAHGLDQPVTTQYLTYIENLLRGDLGISFNTNRPVIEDLVRLFPATFELTTYAMLLGLIIGIPLGVIAGVKRDSWIDHLSRALSVAGVAMPVFWLSLLAIYFLFFQWGLVPAPIGRIDPQVSPPPHVTGLYIVDSLIAREWGTLYGTARILFLPVVVLAFGAMAPIARMTRSGMVEALDSQYVMAARALGIPWRSIVLRYALKNALLPVITMTAVVYGFLLGGSVLVENIFAFPGLGRYAYNAISSSDYPAIQGFILYASTMYVLLFLITDIIYRILDPRIQTS
jgi:ABC-type dipeptide/oligopeptide/nickel transport system permease component